MNENSKKRDKKHRPQCPNDADDSSSIGYRIDITIPHRRHGDEYAPHRLRHILHLVINFSFEDLETGAQQYQRDDHADDDHVFWTLVQEHFQTKDEISFHAEDLAAALLVRATLGMNYYLNHQWDYF
jgi:hypothetical protein